MEEPKAKRTSFDLALEEARRDPEIARSLEGGDALATYEIVRRRSREARGPLGEALAELLKQRRAFLAPPGSVTLQRFNGIGSTFSGSEDNDPGDGSYITTLWFTLVFIPLFPIGQYLVKRTGHRAYQIFGRVPLGEFARRVRIVVAALCAVVVAAGLAAGGYSWLHPTVYFVNGLDVPLSLTVDQQRIDLPAGGHVQHDLDKGPHAVKVNSHDGRLIEEDSLVAPAGKTIVYNALGAGRLYAVDVVYTAGPAGPDDDSAATLYYGQRTLVLDHIDYPFTEPPGSIELENGSRTVHKRVGLVAGAASDGPWWLLQQKRLSEGADLAKRIALAHPNEKNIDAAFQLANALDREPAKGAAPVNLADSRALQLTRDLRARLPESIEANRVYSNAMLATGKESEVLAEFRARFDREPDSVAAGYLLARLESGTKAEEIYRRLLATHPESGWLHRGFGGTLLDQRRYQEAAKEFEKMAAGGGAGDAILTLPYRALALAGSGQLEEALRILTPGSGSGLQPEPIRMFAQTLHRLGKTPKEGQSVEHFWAGELSPGKDDPKKLAAARCFLHCITGDPIAPEDLLSVVNPEQRRTWELCRQAPRDLTGALANAKEIDPGTLQNASSPLTILVAGELLRRGEKAGAERLLVNFVGPLRTMIFDPSTLPPRPIDLDRVSLEDAAAVELLAARATRDPVRRKIFLEAAKSDDLFEGPVSIALASWPMP